MDPVLASVRIEGGGGIRSIAATRAGSNDRHLFSRNTTIRSLWSSRAIGATATRRILPGSARNLSTTAPGGPAREVPRGQAATEQQRRQQHARMTRDDDHETP